MRRPTTPPSGSPPPARAATIARSGAIAGSGRPASADPKPSSANSAAHKATRKIKPREAPAAAKPPGPAYVQCDANIRVRAATTTCSFAQNVFYGYWVAGDSFSAYSPASPAGLRHVVRRGQHDCLPRG